MPSNTFSKPDFVGPHEGRELALMIAGTKPLSMFVEPIPTDDRFFAEEEFDALVDEGKLLKSIRTETVPTPDDSQGQVRRVLYAQADQTWRIPALLMVQDVYRTLVPGFRPDLERLIGLLLGYSRIDIERYIELKQR